jgi:hypothetical protein
MPRYLCETGAVDPVRLDDAVRLAAHRFPEIALEHRRTTVGDTQSQTLWLCRAPSEAHLIRWAEAAQLALASVHPLNARSTASVTPSASSLQVP